MTANFLVRQKVGQKTDWQLKTDMAKIARLVALQELPLVGLDLIFRNNRD